MLLGMFENFHNKNFLITFFLGDREVCLALILKDQRKSLAVNMKTLHNFKKLRYSKTSWCMVHKTSSSKWWKMKTKNNVRFQRSVFDGVLVMRYRGNFGEMKVTLIWNT